MTHQVLRSGVGRIRKYDFAMPSAAQGAGTIIDIAGTAELSNYRLHPTGQGSDANALCSDWATVGKHLRNAMAAEDRTS